MLYLNEKYLREVGINWEQLVDVIERTVRCLGDKDFVQPVKPYLRYRDLKNRNRKWTRSRSVSTAR